MRKEIMIIGTGGQGVKKLAEIIGQTAAYSDTLWPSEYPLYTPAARGEPIISSVVITDRPGAYPYVENPDIIVLLSPLVPEKYLGGKTYWIIDPEILPAETVKMIKRNSPNIIMLNGLAAQTEKKPSTGLVVFGIIQRLVPELTVENSHRAIEQVLKNPKRFEKNKNLFAQGRKII
jgi:Pyruvate/2-oxoacid:ferredoxin oxidoreductase gamma subunit